jgi:hypothetical protein
MPDVAHIGSRCRHWPASIAVAAGLVFAAGAAQSPAVARPRNDDAALAGVRNQIIAHWNVPPGLPDADQVHLRIRMKLDRAGRIVGKPHVMVSGGPETTRKAIADSAYRAVVRAAPFENLPFNTYAASIDLVVNFEAGNLGL